MPKVRPLSIRTKGLPWYKAMWAWLTQPRRWELLEDYILDVPGLGWILVPAGFIFDGASIPRLLWSFLSPTGLLFIPGLFHDFGYKKNRLIFIDGVEKRYSGRGYKREFWDDLFLTIANHVNGMAPINRVAWAAVRAGGLFAWLEYRRAGSRE